MINLHGEAQEVAGGLENLLQYYRFPNLDKDYSINVKRLHADSKASLIVSTQNGLEIQYKDRSSFFRALSILLQHADEAAFNKQETAQFEACSVMLDLSRNAVYRLDEIKRVLSFMALAGHNRCYLYMEDTYDLPGYPYFGYFRGRYSANELKEIDDFAYSLGIEAVPCIQTLAHLATTLKWGYAKNMKDTDDILLVGEDETYRFIETMLTTLKGIFRTNRVHIGMDEAMGLGTGNYLKKHGYKNKYGIMIEHLNRVNEIAKKLGMVPMIWDDMFYRSHDVNHDYYNFDVQITDEDIRLVPPNIALVYWDYYHTDEQEYDKLLAMRDRYPNDIVFAGGIWRWAGLVPSYSKTFVTTNAALAACRRHKVKEIMATTWGDDGSETPLATILPGVILFGEHCYGGQTDEQAVSDRCEFLTGLPLQAFLAIEKLDILPGGDYPNVKVKNPTKHILYQDILMGAFDCYFKDEAIEGHFADCAKDLYTLANQANNSYADLFELYARFADVLALKSRLGIRIRQAYAKNDRASLETIAHNTLPELRTALSAFKKAFAKVWFYEAKGYGFEVIDIRIGGVLSRIDTVIDRLAAYLAGQISEMEELCEEPLPFTLGEFYDENYVSYNVYGSTATQNVLSR